MENETKITENEMEEIETKEIEEEISDSLHTDTAKKLTDDKAYRSGKALYDAGMLIFCILLMLNSIRFFLNMELYIGGVFCTSYINFAYMIPCIIMVIGLVKRVKTAQKYDTEEKGDKTWLVIMSVLLALIALLGTAELIHPSYHVYETETVTTSDGKNFTVAKSETVGIFEEEHEPVPPAYNLDVYDINGIFAKRLISFYVHKGSYEIAAEGNGKYTITATYMGTEETYPFYL